MDEASVCLILYLVATMKVVIANKDWRYIYETDEYYPAGIPRYIIDSFVDAVSFLEAMKDIRDVYTYPGFDSKKKQGEWKDHRGIRLNKQRRILFRQDKTTDPITIVVAYVDNSHYK